MIDALKEGRILKFHNGFYCRLSIGGTHVEFMDEGGCPLEDLSLEIFEMLMFPDEPRICEE